MLNKISIIKESKTTISCKTLKRILTLINRKRRVKIEISEHGHTIRLTPKVWTLLQVFSKEFIDTPSDTIEKLIVGYLNENTLKQRNELIAVIKKIIASKSYDETQLNINKAKQMIGD